MKHLEILIESRWRGNIRSVVVWRWANRQKFWRGWSDERRRRIWQQTPSATNFLRCRFYEMQNTNRRRDGKSILVSKLHIHKTINQKFETKAPNTTRPNLITSSHEIQGFIFYCVFQLFRCWQIANDVNKWREQDHGFDWQSNESRKTLSGKQLIKLLMNESVKLNEIKR